MNYLIRLGIRLLTALLLGINFNLFYYIFSPLTFYLSYYTVKLIGYNPLLGENGFYIDNVFLKFIPACTAASAYFLLVLLILLTKDIGFFKGIFLFLFGSFVILVVNIIRIDFLIYLLIEYGSDVFNTLHLFIWKVLSSVFVALLWIFMCNYFKVKEIPIYSDFKEIRKRMKV